MDVVCTLRWVHSVYLCVCERPKNALLDSTWSNMQQILCRVYVSAKKSALLA